MEGTSHQIDDILGNLGKIAKRAITLKLRKRVQEYLEKKIIKRT